MAGQPLKQACHAALDRNEEEIFERLAAGEFVTNLCRDYLQSAYEDAGKGEPNNYTFYSWLDAAPGRRERFDRVREAAADALAEESVRIVDEAREDGVASTAEATLAKEQGRARRWIASKLNRAKYGDNPNAGVNVNLDIGALHLEALREAGSMELAPARGSTPAERLEARTVEANSEIEDEGEPNES